MSSSSGSLVLPLLLTFTSVSAQQVFFEGDGAKKLTEAIASGRAVPARSQIDTEQIIYPLLKPWAQAIDIMEQNAKALEFADKVEKERRESLVSPSRSIFDFLKPKKKPEPSTTPKPMLERLFDPLIRPIKNEFAWLTKDLQSLGSTTTAASTVIPVKNSLFANLFAGPQPTPANLKNDIRSILPPKNGTLRQTEHPTTATSLLSLLESLGHNEKRREEVEIGRDRTVNVLEMPIGRRDGFSLTPLKGLSVGNQDMFGPIAVNDKYNVNWGIFSELGKMFSKAAQQLTSGTPIIPASSSVNAKNTT